LSRRNEDAQTNWPIPVAKQPSELPKAQGENKRVEAVNEAHDIDANLAKIPIRLDKKRYLHPFDVFGDDRAAGRIVSLSPYRPISLNPSHGKFDARRPVRVEFATAIPVALIVSIQERGGGTAGKYVEVTPVALGRDGKDRSFTQQTLANEMRDTRQSGNDVASERDFRMREKLRWEAFVKAPPQGTTIPAFNDAKQRILYLGQRIPELKTGVAELERRVPMLIELDELARTLHDSCSIQIELLEEF
jgi:hypothetical protein